MKKVAKIKAGRLARVMQTDSMVRAGVAGEVIRVASVYGEIATGSSKSGRILSIPLHSLMEIK